MTIYASKYRIVEAFNDIVDALIEQVNFTNISVSRRDLALRGEQVSYHCSNDSISLLHVHVSYRLRGVHFKEEL